MARLHTRSAILAGALALTASPASADSPASQHGCARQIRLDPGANLHQVAERDLGAPTAWPEIAAPPRASARALQPGELLLIPADCPSPR